MTVQEFSDQFDVLYNNITSNQAPGLNEYEKSVFLTKAQDEVVKNYFSANSQGNTLKQGFDDNAKRQIDFSMLMRTVTPTTVTAANNIHLCNNAGWYAMPSDILIYINEALRVTRDATTVNLTVIPISYQEYDRLTSKPYKRPVKNQAWRLIASGGSIGYTYCDYESIGSYIDGIIGNPGTFSLINGQPLELQAKSTGFVLKVGSGYLGTFNGYPWPAQSIDDAVLFTSAQKTVIEGYMNTTVTPASTVVELIPGPNDTITGYVVRYIARPRPIILANLSNESLTIGGESAAHNCELDPILHEEILQRAVELAKVAWTANGQDNAQMVIQAGQRSE